MPENFLRGGMSSVFSQRLFNASNKYLENFDESTENTFGFMIDANNLYGGVMQKFPLPEKNFELTDQVELSQILTTPSDLQVGYIVEADLEYPQELHTEHSDFPLAPTRESVKTCWFSNYQTELLKKMGKNVPNNNK